jgi:hypothetical protein
MTPPPHSSLVRYPLIYIVICKYFKINIQIEIKQTYCSHYSQVLYKFSLSTSTIFINDKNVVIKFSAQKIKKLQSQIIFILVLGAMKRKDLNRKPKIGYGYLSFINSISPHQHHCQRFTVHNFNTNTTIRCTSSLSTLIRSSSTAYI